MKMQQWWNLYWEAVLIAIAGIFTIFLSVRTSIRSKAKDKKLNAQQETIIELQNKLGQKSDSIILDQRENFKFITGGDGFPLFDIYPDANKFFTTVTIDGIYPLYDLGFTVRDERKWKIGQDLSFEQLQKEHLAKGTTNFLKPGFINPIGHFSVTPLAQELRFHVSSGARNGIWEQLIGLRKKNGKWFKASRIKDSRTQKFIYSHIQPGYLNAGENELEWLRNISK